MNRKSLGIALGGIAPAALLGATLVIAFAAGSQERGASFSPYVDEQGNIERPTGFRENWAHLGTYFVPDDEHARGPGVHDVYAPKETVEAFKQTGEFPDGAVLVKEIRGIESAEMTTGHASWAGEPKVWFVMIKDRQNRFPDSPIWDEGWGWALYTADQPAVNVNEDWQEGDLSNCYGCHLPAEQTDWVFLEGYPTLK